MELNSLGNIITSQLFMFITLFLVTVVIIRYIVKSIKSRKEIKVKGRIDSRGLQIAKGFVENIKTAMPKNQSTLIKIAIQKMNDNQIELFAMEALRLSNSPDYVARQSYAAIIGLSGIFLYKGNIILVQTISKHQELSALAKIYELSARRDEFDQIEEGSELSKKIGIPEKLLSEAMCIIPLLVVMDSLSQDNVKACDGLEIYRIDSVGVFGDLEHLMVDK